MLGDLDLYLYLNIEVAIVRLQWIFFSAMPNRTPNLECSDCRQHVRWVLPFRSWSVIGLSGSLMLVFGLFVIYILHYIIHILKSLLVLFFTYDLYISFHRKSVII